MIPGTLISSPSSSKNLRNVGIAMLSLGASGLGLYACNFSPIHCPVALDPPTVLDIEPSIIMGSPTIDPEWEDSFGNSYHRYNLRSLAHPKHHIYQLGEEPPTKA